MIDTNDLITTGNHTGAYGRSPGMMETAPNPSPKRDILILSANPGDTGRLRLDKEVREIEEGLKRSMYRDRFRIAQKWAVTYWDLRRALMEHEPNIVHFAGHGDKSGLLVEGEYGISEPLNQKALGGLFKLSSHHVECVILNACYSASQVSVIKTYIKYVIGMPGEIKDRAALEFSVGFYDALGAGKTVETAFEYGCSAIDQVHPELTDELKPILK